MRTDAFRWQRPLLLLVCLVALVALGGGCVAPADRAGGAIQQLNLLTFNIRYGTARDGAHVWSARRPLVAALIREQAPDVLALQEALDFQLDDLAEVLTGYRKIGEHREGGTKGEFSGLYVRSDRFRVIDQGQFWLSPTPERVSRGWDAALPRTAAWATLELLPDPDSDSDPDAETNAAEAAAAPVRFRVYGTHFDHRGEEARLESARMIAAHAPEELPVVVMGDLNADPSSAPLAAFVEHGFHSVYDDLHPKDERGTFNGFQDPSGGRRIDHVLVRGALAPRSAEILGAPVNGLYPSDHYAVAATLWPER